MTKEEIRSVIIGKLDLQEDDYVIDIGAGTGSVSIEAALRLKKGKVLAVEHKPEAVELIEKNREKHSIKNLTVSHAKAPVGLENEIKAANKFFIGGSGGKLTDILSMIDQLSASGACIVVSAILISTMYEAYQFFSNKDSYETELSQISVNKITADANLPLLAAASNPVFIITARKRQS